LAISILTDDEGISQDSWNILKELLELNNMLDHFAVVENSFYLPYNGGKRYYIPEDFDTNEIVRYC
jgi:hypothetical protein